MNRYFLTDDQWNQIHNFLQAHPNVYVGSADACRRFINAVLDPSLREPVAEFTRRVRALEQRVQAI